MSRASSSSSGHKIGNNPEQDALSSEGHSYPHPHSFRLGQFAHANSPHVYIFGMWVENEVPRENPCRRRDNAQTPHRQWPWLGIFFFSHLHYNKTTLNKMALFEDLLYLTCARCYVAHFRGLTSFYRSNT